MVQNEYLAEKILKNDRITGIRMLAVEALTKLGYYCRISIQEAGEPVVAKLSLPCAGKQRHRKSLNNGPSQWITPVVKNHTKPHDGFFSLLQRGSALGCVHWHGTWRLAGGLSVFHMAHRRS